MKKRLIVIPMIFVLLLNFASLLSVSAYTGSSSFYTDFLRHNRASSKFSFSADGVLLIHSFFKTNIDIESLLPSDRILDTTTFFSGTWQGRPISELSSTKICDQSDTVGFSQTVSLSYSGDYFVYSVLICLPCIKGDSFTLSRSYSGYVSSPDSVSSTSVLLGVTGLKKVYTTSSTFYTDDVISYTTKSDNQYLVSLFTSDKFTSSSGDSYNFLSSNPDYIGSNYSNISRIASRTWASVYTSNYGLDKGVDLSLKLQSGVNAWNLSVYEIFTDGKYYPGYDDGSSDDDDSGSSGGSADLSKIEQYLQDIIELLKAGAAPPDPHEFWEVYREGLIELFGFQSSEPEEPPPEESEGYDPAESDSPSFEIDEEQFESAMEYVNTEDLGESISGPTGAISFFWHIVDRFCTSLNLYPIIALSLVFCLITWLIRS